MTRQVTRRQVKVRVREPGKVRALDHDLDVHSIDGRTLFVVLKAPLDRHFSILEGFTQLDLPAGSPLKGATMIAIEPGAEIEIWEETK